MDSSQTKLSASWLPKLAVVGYLCGGRQTGAQISMVGPAHARARGRSGAFACGDRQQPAGGDALTQALGISRAFVRAPPMPPPKMLATVEYFGFAVDGQVPLPPSVEKNLVGSLT